MKSPISILGQTPTRSSLLRFRSVFDSGVSSSESRLMCSSGNAVFGLILVGFGAVFFMGFVYAAVVSKLLPLSDNWVISAIQNDWYYCFLVPITLPILLVAVYFHWLSMKLFKHA